MSFTEYVGVEAIFLAIALGFLAYFMGRNFMKIKMVTKWLEDCEKDYYLARPNDRLPSRQEKRKMKNAHRGMRLARGQKKALDKLQLLLDVIYIAIYAWFCVAVHASGFKYASTVMFLACLVDSIIIFNTAAHNWNKVAVVIALITVVATIASWYIFASS